MSHAPILFHVRRPLLTLDTCAAITNKDNDDLTSAIECGELLAFDIRTKGAGRRALRVLAKSLQAYADGEQENAHHVATAVVRARVAEIFPALAETIEVATFARLASCDKDHVGKLVRDELLICVRRSSCNSSARVTRVSAIDFLCRRRVLP